MTTVGHERPPWASQKRKSVNSLWRVGGSAELRAAAIEDFVDNRRTPLLKEAQHGSDNNYEAFTDTFPAAYVPNVDVKTIELVKRSGCYTVQEDGRALPANARTRDESLIQENYVKQVRAQLNDLPPGDPMRQRSFELKMALEESKGGNTAHANYTIGRARVRNVNDITETPFVSPIILRVRTEDKELPPTRCTVSLRTVVIDNIDPTSQLQSVVDYSVHELGDVPISSASDPTTNALLLPYPVSVTTPLHTTLISKRRLRDEADAIRMSLLDTAEKERKAEDKQRKADKDLAEKDAKLTPAQRIDKQAAREEERIRNELERQEELRKQMTVGQRIVGVLFPSTDPLVWIVSKLYRAVTEAVMPLSKRIYSYFHTKERFRKARSNTSYDYFTYGRTSMNVFLDIASDINALCDYVETRNPAPEGSGLLGVLRKLAGIPDNDSTTKPPLYYSLSPRQRELGEFLSDRQHTRDKKTLREASGRPGTTFAFARPISELNIADPSGLRKEYQMNYRIDTYLDIELWDAQFSDIIRISITPGLQAGLEAGRLIQTMGGRLKDDFYTLVAAQDRLLKLVPTPGMQDFFPLPRYVYQKADDEEIQYSAPDGKEALQDKTLTTRREDEENNLRAAGILIDGTNNKERDAQSISFRLRQLLGMPFLNNTDEPFWSFLSDPSSVKEKDIGTNQTIGNGDFQTMPFFAKNPLLQPLDSSEADDQSKRTKYAYEVDSDQRFDEERTSFSKLDDRLALRTLSQLVIPKYKLFGQLISSGTAQELTDSVSNDYHLKQVFAASKRVYRYLESDLKTFYEGERGVEVLREGDGNRQRLRFATLYDLPTDQTKHEYAVSLMGPVYTSSIRSTIPFSSMYPDNVAIQIGASFLADKAQNRMIELVTGKEENYIQIAKTEALEAFAAILVDTLSSTNVRTMSAMHLSESVVRAAKRRLRAASSLIKQVFVQQNGAMVNWDDDLLWLMPASASALIALSHSGCWQYRWDRSSIVQGRSIWTAQLEAFATELLSLSNYSRTNPVDLVPLLNVQSTWVSMRKTAPSDNRAVQASVLQSVKSFYRVNTIARALSEVQADGTNDETLAFDTRCLAHAVQDVILCRPIVWRMEEDRLQEIVTLLGNKFKDSTNDDQYVRPITQEELDHTWASRRIDFEHDDDVQDMTVPVDVGFLSERLGTCNIKEDVDECVYYVPMCCDSLPDMTNPYDAKLTLQLIHHARITEVVASLKRGIFRTGTTTSQDADIVISATSPFKNHRPTHPLLIKTSITDYDSGTPGIPIVHLSISPQVDNLPHSMVKKFDPPFTALNEVSAQYIYADDIVSGLRILKTYEQQDNETSYAVMNARRTVVFATDRLYQALLYARKIPNNGDMNVDVDIRSMPTSLPGDEGCRDFLPDNSPVHLKSFNTDPKVDPMTSTTSMTSNRNMIRIALFLALSLLPETLSDGLSFTIVSDDDRSVDVSDLFSKVSAAMEEVGTKSIPLGEIVACVLHKCF